MKASTILARPLAAALGLAVLAAAPAYAADVVFQEPPAPQPAPMDFGPIATWTGPYAGLQFGYGFGGRVTSPALTGPINNTDGWFGGAFLGYNMQHDMFVYGAEADLNFSRFTGSNAGGDTSRSGIEGSLRARAGVAVTDDILLYGTGGVAAQRLTVNPAGTTGDTQAMLGFTVGAGIDARLTDQVFGRVEYRYSHYGNRNFNFGTGTASVNDRNHRVGVGLGIKF